MLKLSRLAMLAGGALTFVVACGGGTAIPVDGSVRPDAGSSADASSSVDGSVTPDAGSSADASSSVDGSVMPDAGSSADASSSVDGSVMPDAALPPPGPIQYLGYFASAFDGHGTGDHTAETAAAGANLTFILTATETLATKLTTAKAANSKAVVLLQRQLFDDALQLRSDWRAQWEAVAAIVEDGFADTVVAFYPLDEPYWVGQGRGISDDTMRTWLAEIAAAIHQRFPTKAVGTILAVPTLVRGLGSSYVSMFDWVGFDCYGPWDNCSGHPIP
jgi:hypothetical protein